MNHELKKAILELSDNLFGKDYIDRGQLEVYLSDQNSKVISEVSSEGVLMGFSVVRVVTLEQLKEEFYEYPTQLDKHFKPDQLIGFRKSTGVSPTFQNQGLATKMTLTGNQWLEGRTDVLISLCWLKNGDSEFAKILINSGFKAIEKLEKLWYNESLDRKFECGVCGQPPCKCSAMVYAKHIH